MGEGSTTRLFCTACNVEIFRNANRGRIPKLCAGCRREAQRISIRDYCRRKRAGTQPTTWACVDCKQVFAREDLTVKSPDRCPSCWKAREDLRSEARRAQKYAELRKVFEEQGRWTACETCQTSIRVPTQKGPAPRWCDPCRNARKRDLEKAARPWARVGECIECGGPTSRETADKRRDMCPRCFDAQRDDQGRWINKVSRERREIALQFGPTAARLMGPWNDRYIPYDIFVRDRWVCQVCFRKVDPDLRHPDRMSASLDHVIPRSQDGHDYRTNVRLAHQSCNSSRNNRGGNEQLALLG